MTYFHWDKATDRQFQDTLIYLNLSQSIDMYRFTPDTKILAHAQMPLQPIYKVFFTELYYISCIIHGVPQRNVKLRIITNNMKADATYELLFEVNTTENIASL
jgi:hypothetical protein